MFFRFELQQYSECARSILMSLRLEKNELIMNNEAEGLEATLKLNEDIIVVRQSGGILEQPGLFA